MSRHTGAYDPDLQMFVERPRDADPAHIGFLRWLAERGRLEAPLPEPPDLTHAGPTSTVRPATDRWTPFPTGIWGGKPRNEQQPNGPGALLAAALSHSR